MVPRPPGSDGDARSQQGDVHELFADVNIHAQQDREGAQPGDRFMQDLPLGHFILSCCRGVTVPVIVLYMVLDVGH